RGKHETLLSEHGARFDGTSLSLGLAASVPLRRDGDGVTADLSLAEGQSAAFVLRLLQPDDPLGTCPGTGEAEDRFRETVAYWRRWLSQCTYHGRGRGSVQTAAPVPQLLPLPPPGAVLRRPPPTL